MKHLLISAGAAAAICAPVLAEEILPTAVSFNDGAVEQSLSGQPGDAANGRIIVGGKGQGNCVACHMVADLSDVPFQGNIGPALDYVGETWSEAELRGIVSNAKIMFPDSMMPSFYRTEGFVRPGNAYTGEAADDTFGPLLTAQQVEDVVAYLGTLKE